ncbi:MAG: hypothetical protein WC538_22030 [Thermoanaerobaculia bacterium]|jgi:hypothetical protein
MSESRKERIVTPDQLASGYRILGAGGGIWRGEYEVVRRLADGNYLVLEPRPESFSAPEVTR